MAHFPSTSYSELMQCLSPCEQPLIAFYDDIRPKRFIGPSDGLNMSPRGIKEFLRTLTYFPDTRKAKEKHFRCIFQFIMQTRKNGTPSVFSAEQFGCPGFRFYAGFQKTLPTFNHHFTSNGIPGIYPGERFYPSAASAKKSAEVLEGTTAKGKYLVFKHFSPSDTDKSIESIIFFGNPETIIGLAGLVRYATDNDHSVHSIYCSGCSSIFAWPKKFLSNGKDEAILGVFDLAARPWLKPGEMTLAMPFSLFRKILSIYQSTFIYKPIKYKNHKNADMLFGWNDIKRRSSYIHSLFEKSSSDDK